MAETTRKKIEYTTVDFRFDDSGNQIHKGIITWTEIVNGQILDVSKEILGEGTRMKEKLGTTISAVLVGKNVAHFAQELIEYGADRVIVIENPVLEEFITRAYSEAIVQAIKKYKPEIFLIGATTIGRDIAPRIAARLEVGLSADCTEFNIGDYRSIFRRQYFEKVAHFIRPSFGESKLATIIGPWSFPQMATARPGAMMPLERESGRQGTIETLEVVIPESELAVKILKTTTTAGSEDAASSDLLQAHIVIAGGYGIGNEGFDLLKEFVDILKETGHKAALGASRKAVEAGLCSPAIQIGQTGKTIRPQFYIAIGIAGAIQHIAGMKNSKKVIAINKDPDAPIFGHADYGFVCRYEDIIPEMMKQVKNGFKFPLLSGN